MAKEFVVQQVSAEDADVVGALVYALLTEIASDYAGKSSAADYSATARSLLSDHPGVWAFLARDQSGEAAGVLMLNACAAIYAGGVFGEISELYVAPDYRSSGIGALLIDAAAEFGRAQGWPFIEVGAPDVPRWQKSVDFYKSYGFEEIGPRLELEL